MKRILLPVSLVAGLTLGLGGVTFGHGGQYRGPGDTVPPGGGGGGGGGGPSSPGPSGPGSPGGGPSSPGPVGPGSPGGGPAGPSGGPVSGGGGGGGPDLTEWTFWWEFNKEPYLNLKDAVHSGGVVSGSSDFFMGHGKKEQASDTLKPSETEIRQTIVPALLAALETESNNDIVTGAMIALAKIGDPASDGGESEMEPVIAKFLSDSNQQISETAAISLGILAADKSVPTLNHLVQDNAAGRKLVGKGEVNYRTRAFAAYGLGLVGARTASEKTRQAIVEHLVELIRSDATSAQDLKVAAIVALGLVPMDTIESPELPEGGVLAPHSSRMATIEFLLSYLSNEDEDRLTRAHVPTAVVRLLDGLGPEVQDVRSKVAEDFLDRIKKSSKDPREIQQSVVQALGRLVDCGKDDLDKEVRKALADVPKQLSDQQSRYFSLISMAQLGIRPGEDDSFEPGLEDVMKYLSTQIVKGKGQTKPWAGLAMGVLGAGLQEREYAGGELGAITSLVRETLRDEKNAGNLGAFAIAAGMLKDTESKDILLEKMSQFSDDTAKGYCAVGLGLMKERSAIDAINKIIESSKYRPELLKQAAIGLGLLGDKELTPKLIVMLKEANSLATQAAIASALGFIGDRRSIDPLVSMLQDQSLTPLARGFAAVALGIVADKEPLPWNTKVAVDLNYRASTPTLNQTDGTGVLNIL
ncbi:MAG: HEAT repeat domain-containing protein [Planctomycetota bacterium]